MDTNLFVLKYVLTRSKNFTKKISFSFFYVTLAPAVPYENIGLTLSRT